ncbi:MAG TPA: hypothetical protein VKT71_07470 [Candidatus Acidoferrales bacterium]|nr:hypothetical protein [Candidatus Acidoferrales bacterium]
MPATVAQVHDQVLSGFILHLFGVNESTASRAIIAMLTGIFLTGKCFAPGATSIPVTMRPSIGIEPKCPVHPGSPIANTVGYNNHIIPYKIGEESVLKLIDQRAGRKASEAGSGHFAAAAHDPDAQLFAANASPILGV